MNHELSKENPRLTDLVFCAIDLETTGPNPLVDHIIEIGIVKFTLQHQISSFTVLVNPGVKIPEDVFGIHGISDDMVSESPPFEEVADTLLDYIKDTVLVVQNPLFDLSFIEYSLKRQGYPPMGLEAFDTVRLSRIAFPDLKNHKLATISRHLGLNIPCHRALSDATACMMVFISVMNRYNNSGLWNLSDLLKLHGSMIGPASMKPPSKKLRGAPGIEVGKKIKITYKDSDGTETVREIVPVELMSYGKAQYVSAMCGLREQIRYFRIDRIVNIME
jgi:DNA polymerase III epsilon subunit family exonuclease